LHYPGAELKGCKNIDVEECPREFSHGQYQLYPAVLPVESNAEIICCRLVFNIRQRDPSSPLALLPSEGLVGPPLTGGWNMANRMAMVSGNAY
jgi:hypothetical protein